MKTNSTKQKIARQPLFIIGAIFLGSIFSVSCKAANILLPAGSNINDVAVNSLNGNVYYTTTTGKLRRFPSIADFPLPLTRTKVGKACFRDGVLGFTEEQTTYENFIRVTIDVKGILWATIGGRYSSSCLSNPIGLTGPLISYLFWWDGSNWIESPNAKTPADVGSSGVAFSFQNPTIYIVSEASPYEAFYGTTGNASGFTSLGAPTRFRAIDGGRDISTGWAVGTNRSLWNYFANIIPPNPKWTTRNQTGVTDISVNKRSGRIYIIKVQEVWYSDDNGATFRKTGETRFINIAAHSNGTVYAAGSDGSLQSFTVMQ